MKTIIITIALFVLSIATGFAQYDTNIPDGNKNLKINHMNKIDDTNQKKDEQLKHFILYYKLVPDILTARIPFKDEHMSILHELSSRGLVFVGGEMIEGFPAVFMFEGENDDIVKEWLSRDPYFNNNLVLEYRFNQIILVAGKMVNQMKSEE